MVSASLKCWPVFQAYQTPDTEVALDMGALGVELVRMGCNTLYVTTG